MGSDTRGRDVLAAVFDGCDGWLEVRALPSRQRAHVSTADAAAVAAFVANYADEDVYFGVATRANDRGGALADCQHLGALFADLDCKTRTLDEARAALARFPLPPSIVVASGGGLHVYFLLREPLAVADDPAALTALLRRLAGALDGDVAAAEPARILRIPGTTNRKYDPPRPVVVETFEPSRRYNPSEFDAVLPAVSASVTTGPALALDAPIAPGARNPTLYRLARSLRAKALPAAAIGEAVRAVNLAQCRPPLDDAEVVALVANALTQPDRGDFTRLPDPVLTAPAPDVLALTTLGELLTEPDAAPEWLVRDRVPTDGVVLFVGKPKAGKSTLVRALALAVATGRPWLGCACLPRPVVYLALEDKRAEVRRHFRSLGATGGEPVRFVWPSRSPDALLPALERFAASEAPGLIVVDTLQRLIRCNDLNDYAEVTGRLTPLLHVARDAHAAVVLVHHAGKGDRTGIDAPLGSTALTGSVDQVFTLARTERYRLLSSIQRIGPDLEATVVALDAHGAPVLAGTREHVERNDMAVALRTVIAEAREPLTETALGQLVEGRRHTRTHALGWLVEHGLVERTGRGVKGDPFVYVAGTAFANAGREQHSEARATFPDSVPAPLWEQQNRNADSSDHPRLAYSKCCSRDLAQETPAAEPVPVPDEDSDDAARY